MLTHFPVPELIISPMQSIAIVAYTVCLSVCSHMSKTTRPNVMKFSIRYLWPWLGPPVMTVQYVMYFCFYRWAGVMLSHNRHVSCRARLTAEGCQSAGGKAERGVWLWTGGEQCIVLWVEVCYPPLRCWYLHQHHHHNRFTASSPGPPG